MRRTPVNRLRRSRRVKGLVVLAILACVLLVLEAWCLRFAYVQLRKGDDAYASGNMDMARLSWESAASRPAPFNRFAGDAMNRLVEHEKALEAEGRLAEALRACFSIKGIARSTVGYRTYYGEQEKYAAGRIPVLADRMGVELSGDRYTLYRPIREWAAHLAVFFFSGFVLSGFWSIRIEARREGILFGALSACSFLLWLIFLRLA